MNKKLKIIFAGTPDFGVGALQALIDDADFEIVAIITQADKPVGRKQEMTASPIKILAEKNKIKVLQPKKIKEIAEQIAELRPDFMVVIAYRQIIPETILAIPKYGCINVHASLLPRWRGAAVIQAPILAGDTETGVTIMKMDKGLDTGPIIAQAKIELAKDETAETLHDKLAELGAKTLPETLKSYAMGELELQPQNSALATFAPELKKEDGQIDWTKPAVEIERKVRAFTPWPSTFGQIKDKREEIKNLKILEAENNTLVINKYKIGEVFLDNKKLAVQCGEGALVIKKLQLEGGKPMSAEEFLRGHNDFVGLILK